MPNLIFSHVSPAKEPIESILKGTKTSPPKKDSSIRFVAASSAGSRLPFGVTGDISRTSPPHGWPLCVISESINAPVGVVMSLEETQKKRTILFPALCLASPLILSIDHYGVASPAIDLPT